jgi:hypothetical protein
MLIHNADITGSLQINGTLFNTGSFSGSFIGDGSQLDGVTAVTASYIDYNNVDNKPTLISGSSQIAGLGFAITGSNQFDGSQAITGSLTVTGDIIAQTLNVQQVTSSVVYSSGSNVFGNDLSNTQQFTGSLSVTGSLSLNGLSAITGTGTRTENYVPKFGSGGNTIQNSLIFDNGTSVGIGTNSLKTVSSGFTLTIGDGSTQVQPYIALSRNSLGGFWAGIRWYDGDNIKSVIQEDSDFNLRISTSNTERMRITSGGNVGIGTDSPSSNGVLTVIMPDNTNATGIVIKARNTGGPASQTSLVFERSTGAINSQIISDTGTNYLAFNHNGSERMRITSGGNVLINKTNDEGFRLDVNGTGRFSGDLSANDFYTTANNRGLYFNGTRNAILGNAALEEIYLATANGIRVTITSGGNTQFNLPNSGNSVSTGNITLLSTATAVNDRLTINFVQTGIVSRARAGIGSVAEESSGYAAALAFYTRNALDGSALDITNERMRITSGGDVLIGTTSPISGGKLIVSHNGVNTLVLQQNVSSNTGVSRVLFQYNGTSGFSNSALIEGGGETANSGYLAFQTNLNGTIAEKMRITSEGFLKASNNGSYLSSTGLLHEFNTNQNDTNVVVRNTASTLTSARAGIDVLYTASPNSTSAAFYQGSDGTTLRFEVRSNGGIGNYQANDVNLSDERTKKDIELLESYWDKFKAIEIVKFKYKDQTHDDFNIGVIAQQVEQVAPEFVDVDGWGSKPKLDEEGNTIVNEEEPLKSIYTADLYHATIKVLQECMSKIEEQQTQIETLKTENKTLTMEIQSIKDSLK